MMVREKKDINPFLLKLGVALALSFAGFLYSRLRTRRITPSHPPPPPPSPHSLDYGNEVDSAGERTVLRDDIHALQTTPGSCHITSITSEKYEETHFQKITVDSSMVGLSPSSTHSGDKEGFFMPELNSLLREFDLSGSSAGISSKKDVETPRSDVETPKAFRSSEKDDYEQEIKHLRNMVRILRERERNLEVQLLEYYGLKEQETAVMELQNRLKINNMEAKLFSLKIESLQADNRRLEAQVADYTRITTELETARAKIKILKKKLRFEAEQNKEQILALQKRVAKLQDQEQKAAASDPVSQLELQRLKDFEVEVEELRKSNSRLQLENLELARSLESTQILATYVLDDSEAEALKGMSHRLRQENEDLAKEIEQLQADRCTDAEELVYLRWINACLRYELRNYQPPPGKTVARDLSKTLSPKSEERAKQLILEYANTKGMAEKGIDSIDFDSDQWSSSHAYLTDSGEYDDFSVDNSSANRPKTSSKTKIFSKLRRLIHGKDDHHHNQVQSADKTASVEEMTRTYSYESPHHSSWISSGN
ncbi:hypothetical protein L1049_005434 [Liquidambar formosana]|uniref:Protein CHUP1, chloroplastic n=1 Tax=Liquidambar formosana TaxID=63359 RepID=A0AAP0RVF3_LIQFO